MVAAKKNVSIFSGKSLVFLKKRPLLSNTLFFERPGPCKNNFFLRKILGLVFETLGRRIFKQCHLFLGRVGCSSPGLPKKHFFPR